MSAHTPGPWKVSSVKRFIETADGAVTVAEVRGRGRDVNTDVDDDANARLIAAAPGMAEALRDAARWIDTLPDDLRLGSIMPEKIRAALKQAGAL